jgi:LmbE family N-acetylglucosaminyl deacetylase
MLTDRERIERQKQNLPLVGLHRALSRLNSSITIMNTGAHPDDEHNSLLAYLRLALGMRIVVACSTRGEGGQSAIGPERLGALGIVRSREMEEAARELDADIHWLGHGPEDPVHDFGFSKDGDQTFARWGDERTVERLVRAYRTERPDIVLPTFLDVPGQHGHHRAMTRAAETAIRLAADPAAFPEHMSEGLKPWAVSKFYLPAWSGGGETYDDEVPPPPATLLIEATGLEPATGASYDHIGEWSRYYHASQGMGRWRDWPRRDWPLHLRYAMAGVANETSIFDGLPTTLAQLGDQADMPQRVVDALATADACIAKAIASFPDLSRIADALLQAARAIDEAIAASSASLLELHGHRFDRKLSQIDTAIVLTQGITVRAVATPSTLSPGTQGLLTLHINGFSSNASLKTDLHLPAGVSAARQKGTDDQVVFAVTVAADAPLSPQYAPAWSSMGGNGRAFVEISIEVGGRAVKTRVDTEEPLSIAPAHSLVLSPNAIIVPLDGKLRQWAVKVQGTEANITVAVPDGWSIDRQISGLQVIAPASLLPGLTVLTPHIDGQPAMRVTPIAYPHIGRSAFREPETLRVLALDLKLPENAKVGYVGGGADRVGLWLQRMGIDVTELDAPSLAGDLSAFTTIVVGIFAFGIRGDLAAAAPRLHRFVENGGHLVTLYHRPSDGWNPDETPPLCIEIGTPSLRWRVTDPAVIVDVLRPDHPLMIGPNRIEASDWQGWDKERGLYFAARWHKAYQPLLSMNDPGESPLQGSLISAEIGKGRHTHVSLVLHHQLDKLVPGAFKMMANLVQPVER